MVSESISFSPTYSLTHLSRSSRRSSLSMLKQSSSHGLDVGASKLHPSALVIARGRSTFGRAWRRWVDLTTVGSRCPADARGQARIDR
jgi:hypothetical protein